MVMIINKTTIIKLNKSFNSTDEIKMFKINNIIFLHYNIDSTLNTHKSCIASQSFSIRK